MDRWKLVFNDKGFAGWQNNWTLDGANARVENTPDGLVLASGTVAGDDASHCVLWTKPSFSGDIRVEYDFTRLDRNYDTASVCIFFMQATGIGREAYADDISLWQSLRTIPRMSIYYMFMRCYHFSYACSGGKDNNYVRARHYPAQSIATFDADTRIPPSYENLDLFHPDETWHFIFEKNGTALRATASSGKSRHVWEWDASQHTPITSGRLGLRQMWTRRSRYANFKVFQKQ